MCKVTLLRQIPLQAEFRECGKQNVTKQPSGSNTGTESRNFRQTFPHLQLGTCSNYQNSILRKGRCISCVTMLQPSETGVKSCKKWKGKSGFFRKSSAGKMEDFPENDFTLLDFWNPENSHMNWIEYQYKHVFSTQKTSHTTTLGEHILLLAPLQHNTRRMLVLPNSNEVCVEFGGEIWIFQKRSAWKMEDFPRKFGNKRVPSF